MLVAWWSAIPFVTLLLCIAVLPLIPRTAHAWEKNSVKLTVALVLGLPIATWFTFAGAGIEVVHALVEYGQFIILLLALFVVAGGLFLAGDIRATPRNNTIFLAIGAVAASFIGTTGAAMLLIRPLLNTNWERRNKAHTVIFTILVVANSGGLLTPLGDPPLFLGMLRGVPFTWTFGLFPQWLLVNTLLLITYYALDRRAYAAEEPDAIFFDDTQREPLRLHGALNLAFFAGIIAGVAFVPSIDLHALESGHGVWTDAVPWRELLMLACAAGSYFLGSRKVRFEQNQFTWTPILEVAALFIGIFLTMIPALNYLGQIADRLPLNRITMFIFTGGISGVLDNAPTYATFFEIATALPGDPRVAGVPEALLVAISLGAVFGGALTYIGNGPNFMVKSVADADGVETPSFGGYIVASLRFMVPTLTAMALIFLTDGVLWQVLGGVVAVGIVLRAWVIGRSRTPAA